MGVGINGMGRIRIGLARNLIMMAAAAILIALSAIAPAGAQTIEKAKNMIEGVRDARYCEIIPVVRRGVHLLATVYNTLGLNDCPSELWDKITEPAMPGLATRLKLPAGWRYEVMRPDSDLLLGATGMNAVSRIMGFLMICIGVQFCINGVLAIVASSPPT